MATRKSTPGGIGASGYLNWSRREPDAAALEVGRRVLEFENAGSWRHEMAARGARAYQGLGNGSLFQNMLDAPRSGSKTRKRGAWSKHRWNLARALCETVSEKLFGLVEDKTQLVGTDCEWEVRRQGVWADRFIEGNFHLKQGPFLDVWDLCRHGALMAMVSTGCVAARVEEDYVSKRVRTQLRSTLSTFIDPGDVANGEPLAFFDVTWENPEYLVEDDRFKKHKDLIYKSAVVPPHHRGVTDSVFFNTPMVKVVSAWRLPFGSFKGRDARFVGGKAILWEEYEHPTPPLAFFGINPCLGDPFWSENLIEITLGALDQVDDVAATAENTMRRTAQTWLVYDSGNTDKNEILNAKDVVSIGYDSKKGGVAPHVEKPGLLSGDYFAWLDRNVEMAMRLLGVSDMHVLSQSPAGTDSGKAKRLEASLFPERHAKKQRNYRHWHCVDIATLFIRAAQRIGKVEPNWQVTWPGQDFDAKVGVGVLDIDVNQYTIRPYVVSEQKNTPADRAQSAQEGFDRGEITKEQLNIILTGIYDTPRETKGDSVQRRYVAMVLDEILHAEESVIADEAEYMATKYMPPPPWIDPAAALAQGFQVYLQAMMDKVPQNRRQMMRRFLEECQALITKAQQDEMKAQNTNISVDASLGDVMPGADAMPPPPVGAADSATQLPAPGPAVNVGGTAAAA